MGKKVKAQQRTGERFGVCALEGAVGIRRQGPYPDRLAPV